MSDTPGVIGIQEMIISTFDQKKVGVTVCCRCHPPQHPPPLPPPPAHSVTLIWDVFVLTAHSVFICSSPCHAHGS